MERVEEKSVDKKETMMSVQERITTRLRRALTPSLLEVTNESARHTSHASSPGTGESHFAVRIVAADFRGLSRLARHRLVFEVLEEELSGQLHALSLTAWTPEEAGATLSAAPA